MQELHIRFTLRLSSAKGKQLGCWWITGQMCRFLDSENEAIPLGWAAFFGRPQVVAVLLEAGAEPSQRNKNGLTPLGCAVGGTKGRWEKFSNATLEDWQRAVDIIRSYGGVE